MRRKETGVQCSERERTCVCVHVFVLSLWCVFESAHKMRACCSRVCVCLFVCVCVWLDRGGGGGVCYWKVLLSSPVQHAGLAPAVSHGAVPPSPPLPICIRRRQAEMWQTNLAHTVPAASFTWTLSPNLAVTRKTHKMELKQNPPARTFHNKSPVPQVQTSQHLWNEKHSRLGFWGLHSCWWS